MDTQMHKSSPRATTRGPVKKIHVVSIDLYCRFTKIFIKELDPGSSPG